jgi:hypothetical protein
VERRHPALSGLQPRNGAVAQAAHGIEQLRLQTQRTPAGGEPGTYPPGDGIVGDAIGGIGGIGGFDAGGISGFDAGGIGGRRRSWAISVKDDDLFRQLFRSE